MPTIQNSKILIIATNGFEQSELEVPRDTLRDAGATVHVASPDGNTIKGWDTKDWGRDAAVDLKVSDAKVEDYDALVLPGGQINPDLLRVDDTVVTFVREFGKSGKTLAAVCHAPWLLVEADLVKGRKVTSYPSIKTDVINAGGKWEDSEVVVDQAIVTSRNPGDLDAFCAKIIEEVEEGRHERKVA